MNASEIALFPAAAIESHAATLPRIRIVARRNGVGLDRDVELLRQALPIGIDVESHASRSLLSLRELINWNASHNHLLNILVERIPLTWTYASGTTVLIPNQERFPHRDLPRLNRIDAVLCKSRHAEAIFRRYAKNTRYIGFTSLDRNDETQRPDYRRFLHLAGRSTLKGTSTIVDLWAQNPNWPRLTLIRHATDSRNAPVPKNVDLIDEYLDDDKLKRIQNLHGISVCPSLSEGWGHYIVEAMSCRSVVITTDAPPMNELVNEDRGIVVPWKRATPRHLGTNYQINREALEAAIRRVIDSRESDLEQMGMAARRWYESNQRDFHARMGMSFDSLLYPKEFR